MREDDFIGQQFTWYTGIVEDIKDPLILNRVRVRCIGIHSSDTSLLTTEDLPWATVIMPNTAASYKGIGANHHLEVGSWVVGFFRDGSSAQDPMVMGSIATQESGVKDIPSESQLADPTNKVYRSKAGHLIELDNTAGSERISIQHGTNKTAFEIKPNGFTTIKSRSKENDDGEVTTHTLEMDPINNHIHIGHHSGTSILINSEGTVSINAVNDVVNIDGNTTITGKLDVTGEVTAKAGEEGFVTLTGHTHVEVPGTGGSSSPTPATAETQSPTKGT